MSPSSVAADIGGERVELLGARALFWPARRRLLIADLHLGKADIFRSAGIALPRGGTRHDLDRLSALANACGANEIWVLGDMLHGAANDSHWRAGWIAWREQHHALRIAVLTGNHDRALASAGLDVELLGEAIDDGPFALRHAPRTHSHLHVICGHLHPRIPLPGVPGRWPVFWLRAGCTVLPAFSEFTGGSEPLREPSDRLVVCVDDAALALP
ncbi:MAG: ligase-associated DNA damage response endonuclease PdeM [Luteimonas sp.]